MLTFTTGDLFDEPADIRVNTVNCVGVMGKGVALQFKERYPKMYEDYKAACDAGEVKPGTLHVWKVPGGETIVNFPTKRHWKQKSRYEDIDSGLEALHRFLKPLGQVRVALPALGCGHGGLDWEIVSTTIKGVLGDLSADIIVFEPASSRRNAAIEQNDNWRETRDLLVGAGYRIADVSEEGVPSGIRDLFPDRVFLAGDLAALRKPIVGLVDSDHPTDREVKAAEECAKELCRNGCAISVVVSDDQSLARAYRLGEVGCNVVIVPSTGVLAAENRGLIPKTLKQHLAILSIQRPDEQREARGVSGATLFAIAKAVLITSAGSSRSSFPLASAKSRSPRPVFVVDYGDSSKPSPAMRFAAGSVARNRVTGRPNLDSLLRTVGIVDEPTREEGPAIMEATEKSPISDLAKQCPTPNGRGYPKRLIEVDLPIARISAHARREKSIRHGHISTLHIWWARRPLAACRAVICAALWPDPADPLCPPAFRVAAVAAITAFANRVFPPRLTAEGHQLQETLSLESRERWEAISSGTLSLDANEPVDMPSLRMALLDFIADFASWYNSTVPAYLETSRALTQAAHEALEGAPGTRPLVVDPFAGGGSIPLEALRVGADAFASDLNPVPVLLNKVVLEYIPKYGKRLAEEVRKWGEWIKKEAEKELAVFYPDDPDGATPIAYLWARTIRCEGPACGAEVPLIRSLWLARKTHRSVALRLVPNPQESRVDIDILVKQRDGWVSQSNSSVILPLSSNFEDGTVKRGSATCPCCGYTTPVVRVRSQLRARRGGAADAKLLCVALIKDGISGRIYRTPVSNDLAVITAARQRCEEIQESLPHEQFSGLEPRRIPLPQYGINGFVDIFTPRQLVGLATITKLIRHLRQELEPRLDTQFATAIQCVLALAVSKAADLSNSLCSWKSDAECPVHLFARQAIPMVWDFAEANLLSESSGSWTSMSQRSAEAVESAEIDTGGIATVEQCSATNQVLPDDVAHVTFTDPPYYYSVPYADLSDFFYVWLKRCLDKSIPSLFTEELTPKAEECIQNLPHSAVASRQKDRGFYERTMQRALESSRRVTRHDGLAVVVFAHTETEAWEALVAGLVAAGWQVMASWPIDTEMEARTVALRQRTLGSSIHLVCRPRVDASGTVSEAVGEWRDVLGELPKRIHEWMPRLAAEGVVGADAIFACLGPALEIFSRYSRVEKANGETASLREYLEHVWAAVSTEALSLIFKDANAAGLEPDARLSAMWLWTIGGGGANGNGNKTNTQDDTESSDEVADEEEASSGSESKGKATGGFLLEYDAARKIAQGLGVHLEQCESLVEIKGDKARLLPVAERTPYLFGQGAQAGTSGPGRKKKPQQKTLFAELDDAEAAEAGWSALKGPPPGATMLDRVHQAMILFAANRAELLKRFLVEDAVGKDGRFWKLADNLNKLYPPGTDERRWIEGVLARKKGLGQ